MARSMAGAPSNNNMVEVERELVSAYGFVPELFRTQSADPRLISAESRLLGAVLVSEGHLTRRQKEILLFAVASARGNEYCLALHAQAVPPNDQESRSLLDFASQLASRSLYFSAIDIERLTHAGFDDQAILELWSPLPWARCCAFWRRPSNPPATPSVLGRRLLTSKCRLLQTHGSSRVGLT